MLLKLQENNPTKEDVENLLNEIGINIDFEQLKQFFLKIEKEDYNELISRGEKLLVRIKPDNIKEVQNKIETSQNNIIRTELDQEEKNEESSVAVSGLFNESLSNDSKSSSI